MKILIFGGSGQLGLELISQAHDLNFEVIAPVISEVDISNEVQLNYLTERCKPNLVINCAAYVAVDKAESEPQLAELVNVVGATQVARAAAKVGARLIHVSTDYVFAGNLGRALSEKDAVGPVNVYGSSKLAGEKAVLEILGDKALVVRTSSLHARRGVNFVNTMLRLFQEQKKISVVSDQIMSPTWAGWLAEVLLDLGRIECHGIVHASGAGAVSWFEFACAIHERVKDKLEKGQATIIQPILAAEFKAQAQRPIYSVLDCSYLSTLLGRAPISWQSGLESHLSEIH